MNRLVLPLPPSVNHSHKQWIRNGRVMRLPTQATKLFQSEAGYRARKWASDVGWIATYRTKVIMRYWIWWPDKRKRDAGNVEKVLSDSLKGILYDDDQYLLPRAMDFDVDRGHPRIEVELEIKEE